QLAQAHLRLSKRAGQPRLPHRTAPRPRPRRQIQAGRAEVLARDSHPEIFMLATFRIFRYNPESGGASHYDSFKLEVDPMDRVLDVLERLKGEQDSTLTYRRS